MKARTLLPLLLLAALLAGCGGGDIEDDVAAVCPTVGERFDPSHGICPGPVVPPDCSAKPELC